MSELKVKIITPQGVITDNVAHMLVIPACEGEFGLLPNHTPLLTNLKSGFITLYNKATDIIEQIFISSGLCQVQNNDCIILTNNSLDISQYNITDLEQQITDLKQKISQDLTNLEPRIIANLQEEIESLQKLKSVIN
jgi:F-type H+-transporting ATPase subunit epsilon